MPHAFARDILIQILMDGSGKAPREGSGAIKPACSLGN
jgi:hypothetical protein